MPAPGAGRRGCSRGTSAGSPGPWRSRSPLTGAASPRARPPARRRRARRSPPWPRPARGHCPRVDSEHVERSLLVLLVLLCWRLPRRARPPTPDASASATSSSGADRVRVDPGDAVTWTNRGDVLHTVTSRRGAPERFRLGRRWTRARPFSRVVRHGRAPTTTCCTLHPTRWAAWCRSAPTAVKPTVSRVSEASAPASGPACAFRLSEESRVTVKLVSARGGGKVVRTLRARRLGPPAPGAVSTQGLAAGPLPRGGRGHRSRGQRGCEGPAVPLRVSRSRRRGGCSPRRRARRWARPRTRRRGSRSSSASLVVRSDSASTLASFHRRAPARGLGVAAQRRAHAGAPCWRRSRRRCRSSSTPRPARRGPRPRRARRPRWPRPSRRARSSSSAPCSSGSWPRRAQLARPRRRRRPCARRRTREISHRARRR